MKITDYIFNSSSNPVIYGFTGREFDLESKTYYYRNRQYNPDSGKFLSQDPIGIKSGDTNLNRYVLNNSLNYSDPYGKTPLFSGLIGAASGGIAGGLISVSRGDDFFGKDFAVGAGTGFAIGSGATLFASLGTSVAGQAGLGAIGGSLSGFTGNLLSQTIVRDEVSLKEATIAGGVGGAAGLFSGSLFAFGVLGDIATGLGLFGADVGLQACVVE